MQKLDARYFWTAWQVCSIADWRRIPFRGGRASLRRWSCPKTLDASTLMSLLISCQA